MSTNWQAKIQALLRCPPEGCLLTDDEARERAIELLGLLGKAPEISKLVECAHRGAFGVEGTLVDACTSVAQQVARHPFSAQPLSMYRAHDNLEQLRNRARSSVDAAVRSILCQRPEDDRSTFLRLWRTLPELLCKSTNDEHLADVWSALPASSSLPYQSVWQHARVASALTGAGERPAILVFSIASAQEFLATARRTQDLWMGSLLLSYLTWSGMKPIVEALGPDSIIIPDLLGQPLVDLWLEERLESSQIHVSFDELRAANLPNIFTALVPAEQGKKLAQSAEESVYGTWEDMAKAVKAYVEGAAARATGEALHKLNNDSDWAQIWKRQGERFLRPDVFWSLALWPEASNDVQRAHSLAGAILGKRRQEQESEIWRTLRTTCQSGGDVGALYAIHAAVAGRALEARKNLRAFAQTPEDGEKCTLCGQRSALRRQPKGNGFSYRELAEFWNALGQLEGGSPEEGGKLIGRIRKGERLCSVCLTKRLAWEGFFLDKVVSGVKRQEMHILFPSTSSMATASFRRNILTALVGGGESPGSASGRDNALYKALCQFTDAATKALKPLGVLFWSAMIPGLKRAMEKAADAGFGADKLSRFLRLDGDWFYETNYDPTSITYEYALSEGSLDENAIENLNAARAALRTLIKQAKEIGIPAPDTYYALVAMDGDHLGQWLSGQRAPALKQIVVSDTLSSLGSEEMKRPAGAAAQAALAEAAKTFALHVVPHVVEKRHCGRLIYAGGDDVLALVPLDELFPILRQLKDGYQGAPDGWWSDGTGPKRLAMGNQATISAGVVIAHHTHPFSQVVETVHEGALQADAKQSMGRDAFALRVLKRAGEELHASAKWTYSQGSLDTLASLDSIVRALSGGDKRGVSDQFIHTLDKERSIVALPQVLQEQEITRIIGRSTSKGEEEIPPDGHSVDRQVIALLKALTEEADPQGDGGADGRKGNPVDHLVELLSLARFLASGRRTEA